MTSDVELAAGLARGAGEMLLGVRTQDVDAPTLKHLGDTSSHRWLMAQLAAERPGDAVLSEEGKDDPARLAARRVWIVDPLDGTREFSEPPRDDWAVHVALWEDGELACGAVALPARGIVYRSDSGPLELPPRSGPIRLAVSRTRPPAFVAALAEALSAELVPMGSAGVKATAVLRDEVDAYVHAGGQHEWDSAAPVAVTRGAGMHTSRIDGSALKYNQPDSMLPDVLISRPEVADEILQAISRVQKEASTA